MTPEILINWILEGRIYDLIKLSGDYAEDGRSIWPERIKTIVQWAEDAKEQADSVGRKGRCGHVRCSHWQKGGSCRINYTCKPLRH